MKTNKFINVLVLAAMLASLFLIQQPSASAAPGSPTDETKVPHYFGPYPNWANSPYTLPDVAVQINGDGQDAQAEAVVGANGTITELALTSAGSGYTTATVTITGAGSGAAATVDVATSGSVTGVSVSANGSGYSQPEVVFTGPAVADPAVATAYGEIDQVQLLDGGYSYQFPTVDFDMPDSPDGVQAKAHAQWDSVNGNITAIILDNPGSGYSKAPNVVIRDGTLLDPIVNSGTGALASASLKVTSIVIESAGDGYTAAPGVDITDPTGTGAAATAQINLGAITAINLVSGGAGYITSGGIQKFTDELPGLCLPPSCPTVGKYIPLGVPEVKTYNGVEADEYVIGLVQYRTSFSSSLPDTLVRGYVQLETPANAAISQHYPVTNEMLDGSLAPVMQSDGVTPWLAVTPPQWLGPTVVATKDRPVRVVFYNLLPKGAEGDLFLPTDSTMMGAGMGPMPMLPPNDLGTVMDEVRNPICSEYPKPADCFKDNRATLHLHGGITPWISDGTPHQWITPANENTMWPQGVSVGNVPDMNVCAANNDGCQTFYYTNQQSARLMFYHDHAWGITRLNVYAGEAAGYIITDDTEQALLNQGLIPGAADTIAMLVQDRTFVPDAAQLAFQDPTWDAARWGSKGSFWYHHVYMPAQNPGDPGGMSAYGRWMYGPWFWPPALDTVYGPIDNPYYDPACKLDDPNTWQYQTDPFCEPHQIPGTPNISAGMEQFNDTPIVNGVAYPTLTVEPKAYRMRFLNAANDRFFNFQWYVGDPTTASTALNSNGEVIGATEVALNPDELAAAQQDPVIAPNPVQSAATAGPDWIQIGTEGGFLPAPVVVDGQQPTTYITDPTRFDIGNVDQHSLLIAPAERADVIVDFSKFAGKTLIMYNDAPAAFPARVPVYDYYTGAPDLSPVGAPTPLPGYGPNTRTIMQVKVAAATPAIPYDLPYTSRDKLGQLQSAFRHKADGSGVFESGQHPIIVAQADYNSAYGTTFLSSSNCNVAGSPLTRCDGYVRVNDVGSFSFNTLLGPNSKLTLPMQPKAIHDEMNSVTFDEFGRMTANLGLEAQPPTPGLQNVALFPFINPATELLDGTNMQKANVKVTPIATTDDGTQIWRFTHNGVDTHPIHFHLFDVQVINRVTWDNIIIPPDRTELGWKDTVRMAPLEDTIVALRPIIPSLPWEIPNSVRPLDPMMPLGSTAGFGNLDVNGDPTPAIVNSLVNFGWEYVFHCHILSHEEMDMMRPVSLAVPPRPADNLSFALTNGGLELTLSWRDNTIAETGYLIQRNDGSGWIDLGTLPIPLNVPNTSGDTLSFIDTTYLATNSYEYRVVALNTVGYGEAHPILTVQSTSPVLAVASQASGPTNLTAALLPGLKVDLAWNDNATSEVSFSVMRSDNGGAFVEIASLPANAGIGPMTYTDPAVAPGNTYDYQVSASDSGGLLGSTNIATVVVPALPGAPTNLAAAADLAGQVSLSWNDNATNEDGFIIERADNGGAFVQIATAPALAGVGSVIYLDTTTIPGNSYEYRVAAQNISGLSAYSNVASVVVLAVPAAPTALSGVLQVGPVIALSWSDNANNETGFIIERATNGGAFTQIATPAANPGQGMMNYTDSAIFPGNTYAYRVIAANLTKLSAASNTVTVVVPAVPDAPTSLSASLQNGLEVRLKWKDKSTNETGFIIERAVNGGAYAQIATAPGNGAITGDISYTDLNIAAGTSYSYRVAAIAGVLKSAYSNVATINVPAAPAAPTNFVVVNNPPRGRTSRSVTLTWGDASNNETGFTIEVSTSADFTNLFTTSRQRANTTRVVIQNLRPNTDYYFRIRSVNGNVSFSAWVMAVPAPIHTPQ